MDDASRNPRPRLTNSDVPSRVAAVGALHAAGEALKEALRLLNVAETKVVETHYEELSPQLEKRVILAFCA
jgi:hypothetical protein